MGVQYFFTSVNSLQSVASFISGQQGFAAVLHAPLRQSPFLPLPDTEELDATEDIKALLAMSFGH
jgi:hypothetical protein